MEEKIERLEQRDERVEEMIRKVERWEEKKGGIGSRVKEGGGDEEECMLRLRRMEIRQDKKEREERRSNVVVTGVGGGEEVEKEVKKLWARMGMEDEGIREVRRVGRTGKEGSGLVVMKLAGRDEKRKVMEARRKLKGRRERIDDDLTEEERRARWKVEREAEKEREGGKKVQVEYMKMWVNGKMRRWDELWERWCDEQGNEC